MIPIVFLDMDDVLCLNDPYTGFDALDALRGRHESEDEVLAQLFAPAAVAALTQVHERMQGRVRYVISSTWREFFQFEEFCDVLRHGGLGFVADGFHPGAGGEAWCTPPGMGSTERVAEISNWLLLHHRREPFAIIDDETSGASLGQAIRDPRHLCHDRIVLCDPKTGLHAGHVERVVQMLSQAPVSKSHR